MGKSGHGPRIEAATIGKIQDYGIKDANNMGAAMAPAAIDTLQAHFRDPVSYTHLDVYKRQVKDLQLWYGQTKALKGVSMNIPEKSITALIGPSGCGKSTFLKTLDRMNDLVPGVRIEGEVKYNGQDIFAPSVDVNELRREIGMVFQKPNPFPMSIYDNIEMCIRDRSGCGT